MRTFHIGVNKRTAEITCTPPAMHVAPGEREEILVCLDSRWIPHYKLGKIGGLEEEGPITQIKLNDSTICLHDDNPGDPGRREHQAIPFTVRLIRRPGSTADKVKAQNPVIVNDAPY